MANVLTDLAPVLYKAAQVTPRYMTGMIASVDQTFDAKQVAKGDSVKVPIIGASAIGDFSPEMSRTVGASTTPGSTSLTMDYAKEVTWHVTGEEYISLSNGGDNAKEFMRQKTEKAIGTLCDYIEAALCVAAKQGASRATGTAGTTPFATTITELVDLQKILIDNGFFEGQDVSVVLNSSASSNLKKLVTINNQPAGSPAEQILRGGTMINLHRMNVKESAQFVAHTIGTASGTQLNSGGSAIGSTSLAYDTDVNGPWTAGDVMTIGSGGGTGTADTNKYIVAAANTSTPLLINAPGLRIAHVDNDVLSVGAAYTPSIALARSALKLVVRPIAINDTPLVQNMMVSDPVSGLTFMFTKYLGVGMDTYAVSACFGMKVIQSEGIATLLG